IFGTPKTLATLLARLVAGHCKFALDWRAVARSAARWLTGGRSARVHTQSSHVLFDHEARRKSDEEDHAKQKHAQVVQLADDGDEVGDYVQGPDEVEQNHARYGDFQPAWYALIVHQAPHEPAAFP